MRVNVEVDLIRQMFCNSSLRGIMIIASIVLFYIRPLDSLQRLPKCDARKAKTKKSNFEYSLNNFATFHRTRNSFRGGQIGACASPWPDQRQIIHSEHPVVLKSSVLLPLDSLNCAESKRVLRQSNSISPTRALLSPHLN